MQAFLCTQYRDMKITILFYKSIIYKNVEAEIGQILRIF